ncbi:MAG TPA: DUF2892 domain-containing protein, partial [Gemmatimonadales bacterium]
SRAMRQNVGRWDRVIRGIAGVLLLGLYGALQPPLRYFTLIGLMLIATALMGRCPLYTLLGISTCRRTV